MMVEILNLIRQYEKPGDFTYSTFSNVQATEAQTILSLTIPAAYVEFLRMFGHGGICGIEVIGIGKTGKLLFVEETLKFRSYGLPDYLIVIENCDEWVYCIDCRDGHIVSWSDDIAEDCYNDFDTYLLDRFKDGVENN